MHHYEIHGKDTDGNKFIYSLRPNSETDAYSFDNFWKPIGEKYINGKESPAIYLKEDSAKTSMDNLSKETSLLTFEIVKVED
jgi:hypothetical protein